MIKSGIWSWDVGHERGARTSVDRGVCPHFNAVIISAEEASSLGLVRWAGGITVGIGV